MHETSAPRQSHFLKTETILTDFQPVAFESSRNSFWEYGNSNPPSEPHIPTMERESLERERALRFERRRPLQPLRA